MTTKREKEIIEKCKDTRKRLDRLKELTGSGGGMLVKAGVRYNILFEFFTDVNEILAKGAK